MSIFDKQWVLKPSIMRTVAERRFDDAKALQATGLNARANGVAYLAGFVVEILLKAKLIEKFQHQIWKVVDRTLNRSATLDVSLILAFAPTDLASAGN